MTVEGLTHDFVPEKDYYHGIPTILTSLEAAIVIADKLANEIPEGEEFFDEDFGPKKGEEEANEDEDDNDKKDLSMYYNGSPPANGYPKPSRIEWIKPEEICEGEEVQFINDGASANDVKQGRIGDCWLISALSVIATRDELITGGMKVTPNFNAT
jgi:Calpain family cysteine protease